MTPPTLARQLQSLPPMLHMRNPSPMPRCSKSPRGLFVQVCVTRVFTGISVSPGPSLRQRLSRYTFRAGRNFDVMRSLSSRSDYAFICGSLRRVRRVVALTDFACTRSRQARVATALQREQSLRGHEDFPRRYPSASASAGGLHRYEPAVVKRITSLLGKLWLTRQGISLP